MISTILSSPLLLFFPSLSLSSSFSLPPFATSLPNSIFSLSLSFYTHIYIYIYFSFSLSHRLYLSPSPVSPVYIPTSLPPPDRMPLPRPSTSSPPAVPTITVAATSGRPRSSRGGSRVHSRAFVSRANGPGDQRGSLDRGWYRRERSIDR